MPCNDSRFTEHITEIDFLTAATQMRKINKTLVEVFYLDAEFVDLFDLLHKLFHFAREELLSVWSDAAKVLMTEYIIPFIVENFFEPRNILEDGDDILDERLRLFERKVFCVLVHVYSLVNIAFTTCPATLGFSFKRRTEYPYQSAPKGT